MLRRAQLLKFISTHEGKGGADEPTEAAAEGKKAKSNDDSKYAGLITAIRVSNATYKGFLEIWRRLRYVLVFPYFFHLGLYGKPAAVPVFVSMRLHGVFVSWGAPATLLALFPLADHTVAPPQDV